MTTPAQRAAQATPRTDAAIIEFEYEIAMLGGETGGSSREIVEPDFARQLETELEQAKLAFAPLRDALEYFIGATEQVVRTGRCSEGGEQNGNWSHIVEAAKKARAALALAAGKEQA